MRLDTISTLAGFAVVSALAVAPAIAAGPTNLSNGAHAQSPQENCQARPDNWKQGEKGDRTGSVTKKLGKCGGVLQPPEINDPGLVKPAPDAGAMPVIKPGQVPEQAPRQK